jgi:hypothetical protein
LVNQPLDKAGPLTPVADYSALTTNTNKSRLLEAVKFGHQMWRLQARFQNISINAVSAMGVPGCLAGPALEPLIKTAPGVAGDIGNARDLRDAVARGVSTCFADWQGLVTVPGLPWYPSFAAFPAPQAPPMPNVPTPLIACPSGGLARLGHASLKQEMIAALPAALKAPLEGCVGQLAQSLAQFFTMWLPMQMVTQVLGQGPIPSFAPPYVPVGPVLNGSIISAPGHLMAGSQPPMIVV